MADGQKTEKATPKKRRDERKKGNIFFSNDAVSVVVLLVSFLVLRLSANWIAAQIYEFLRYCMDLIAQPSMEVPAEGSGLFIHLLGTFVKAAVPLMAAAAVAGVVATFFQTKLLVSGESLRPKLSRISPLQGVKRLFSLRSVVEALKGLLKIAVLLILIFRYITNVLDLFTKYLYTDLLAACAHLFEESFLLSMQIGAAFAVLAAAWRLWQKRGFSPEGRAEIFLVAALLGGYWAVQLVFAFVLEVQPTRTWDFGLVFSAAQQYAQSGVLPGDYFSQFHNNAPMYLVLVALFKVLGVLGVQNVIPAALVCNTLCVNVSLLVLYRVLRRLYGVKNALFGLAGAFLFLPFLLYGPIVYTDTVTLPFPIGALSLAALHSPWLPAYDREKAIPWQHWVMMGLSGDGGYNDDDYKLTLEGEDYSARVQIAQTEIVRRVEEMGPGGLLSHGLDKLSYIFGDGLYYAPMKLDIGSVHKGNLLQAYFIQGMRHTGRAVYAALGVQAALLAGLAVAGVRSAFQRRHRATVLRVAVLGLALFLLLWEARSRYLVNFLPVMLAAAFPAVDEGGQSV